MSDGFLGATDARAWWSTVRAASRDLARMERAVGRMRAREGLRGAPVSGTGRSSGPRDANLPDRQGWLCDPGILL